MALFQVDIQKDIEKTSQILWKRLSKIKQNDIDCLVLPEMFLGTPIRTKDRQKWVNVYQEEEKKLIDWAQDKNTALFYSGYEKAEDSYYNTAVYISKKGQLKRAYRKIHLFKYDEEDKIYKAGHRTKVLETELGQTGFAICFDIRFPEMIRRLRFQGMELCIVSAQWPASRIEHWESLLKARAIENQAFVIACNRLGEKKGILFNGHSMIIDPWGKTLAKLSAKKEFLKVKIDLDAVNRIRKAFPFYDKKGR